VAPAHEGLATYWKDNSLCSLRIYCCAHHTLIYLWHSSLVWAIKKADIRAEKTGALTASEFNMSGALDISLFGTKKDPKVIYFALPDCCAACCYHMV
jgi:hypothetical protein